MPRIYSPTSLYEGQTITLPPAASRHVQVLRLQPGDALTLFNGHGGEYSATVTRMGRTDVEVWLQTHYPIERETAMVVHLAVGMPANERMDWLVEKATELGAASIQPLMTAHSVLRLKGERAEKKQAHWQAQAIAACEQCGRNRIPTVHPIAELESWLIRQASAHTATETRSKTQHWVLSLHPSTQTLSAQLGITPPDTVWLLSGPEGGLSAAEDHQARMLGWQSTTLGPRILRAETAAIAALSALGMWETTQVLPRTTSV